jgi:heme-degrading monooxygenase HmoA
MKPIVLIHPFQVETHQEQEFLNAWKQVDYYMQNQAGFIETSLHKALSDGLKAFSFVNIAHWESADAFFNAVKNPDFQLLSKHVLNFSKGPGLYEIIS